MNHTPRFLALLALLLLLTGCGGQAAPAGVQSRLLADAAPTGGPSMVARGIRQTGTLEGFEHALAPHTFRFPEDLGPHPTFKLEWWYYTGNLQAADGRRFGYQLTIFRQGLVPPRPEPAGTPASAWRTTEGYLAHLAITDVAGQTYRQAARLVRGGKIGLAGAQAQPFRVWAEDWQIAGDPQHMALRAADAEQGVGLDLQLDALKPPVLQGDNGLSQKSDERGSASYYFSLTRLQTRGTVVIGGAPVEVSGLSWMDREWSTGTLGGNIGWDWFALHLSDGSDLMWYQLRQADGGTSSHSQGSLTDQAGAKTTLLPSDMQIRVLDRWRSPRSGASYPSRWRMSAPSHGIDLEIRPLVADQEIPGDYVYWEGAVEFSGTSQGKSVSGYGYVEMTGYIAAAGLSP